MEEKIKAEIEKGLQEIIDRFSGNVRESVKEVVADINMVLATMISEPEQADKHHANLKVLYANLSTRAAISERETREIVSKTVLNVMMKITTTLVLAI